MSTEHPSKMLQTVLAMINAYNAWDTNKIIFLRAPDCIQRIFPESLKVPCLGNAEYRQKLEATWAVMKNFTLTVKDTWEDFNKSSVTVHATSTADTPIGPYANEYLIIIKLTDDHEKVREVNEFVDSAFSLDFHRRLAKAAL